MTPDGAGTQQQRRYLALFEPKLSHPVGQRRSMRLGLCGVRRKRMAIKEVPVAKLALPGEVLPEHLGFIAE